MKNFTLFIASCLLALSSFAQVDLTEGLVFHLPCDNGEAAELIGELEGTVVGELQSAEGFNGTADGAMVLDGASYIDFVDADIVDLPIEDSPRTIALWVNTATTTDMHAVSYGTTANGQHVHLALRAEGTGIRNGFWYADYDAEAQFNDETWHHVAAVYDDAECYIYFDGELLDLTNDEVTVEVNTVLNGNLRIGAYNGKSAELVAGMLDDIRIYNLALTEEGIAALFELDPDVVVGNVINTIDACHFNVYPTTTNSELNIKSNLTISSMELINISGKVVKTLDASNSVDVSDLTNGVYFIKGYHSAGSQIAKFVKK